MTFIAFYLGKFQNLILSSKLYIYNFCVFNPLSRKIDATALIIVFLRDYNGQKCPSVFVLFLLSNFSLFCFSGFHTRGLHKL